MIIRRLLWTILALAVTTAQAVEPFETSVSVSGGPAQLRGFQAIEDMLDSFRDSGFAANSGYTGTEAVSAAINLRGFQGMSLSYPTAGSPTLVLSIPALGINETFNGATRDQSQQLLRDYFKGSNSATLPALLKALVANSPIDPVAGNPLSLMGQMAQSDFDAAMGGAGSSAAAAAASATGSEQRNFVSVGARLGKYSQREFDSTYFHVPLGYTHLFSDRRYGLSIDVPLTYIDYNGAKSYSFSIGASLRMPTGVAGWSLAPGLRFGATASPDLGAAAMLYSLGLSSLYDFAALGRYQLSLVNMLATYRTQDIKAGGYNISYDLSNTVFRNGLVLQRDIDQELLGTPLMWEAHLVRTDFTGDALYSRYSDEIAFSVGTRRRSNDIVWNALRLGLNYMRGGGGISGLSVNFGYTF